MTDQRTRDRIFKLATDGLTISPIAERLGMTKDQVRRIIERAEARGEVPAGTLLRACPNSKKAKKAVT